jgi:hypothetical protein
MSDMQYHKIDQPNPSLAAQGDQDYSTSTFDSLGDDMMETILENINNTPIGRVLKRISELPEIRKGKVLRLRRQLTEGNYDVSDRLDSALDKVLEDLMI